MVSVIAYGLTIGGILYIISIGFSFTFGTMKIVNFAHALIYSLGAYFLVAFLPIFGDMFVLSSLAVIVVVIPIAYLIERLIIRRLYGESIHFAIIATYAVLLIGIDATKWIWGASPIQLSDPIGSSMPIFGVAIPVYRMVIIALALIVATGIELVLQRSMVGKIVVAGLEDPDAVKSLGIDVNKYFTTVFIIGSCFAALGGILYAPITAVEPYMGNQILLLCFAVVVVGGLGNWRGTLIAAFSLGMLMSVTGRVWGPAADVIVFVVLAISLTIRPIDV
jgi:branched-subunit amino acid ABC-type transport system permease component